MEGTRTRNAVTYATFPAVLEAPTGSNGSGIVTAYSDGSITIDAGARSLVTCAIFNGSATSEALR